jgi:CheY-like chemotaxis protein
MPEVKIYVVDDDEDDRFFLRDAVNAVIENPQIIECVDGQEFIDSIQAEKNPDTLALVLVDMNMPKINGLEVASFMQNHQVYNKIPVIMVSTSQNKELIQKAYSLGIKKYMVKPSSATDFQALTKYIRETVIQDL